MEVRNGARPVPIHPRHVHPGREGAGEGIQDAFGRRPDLGHAQDVIDVGDDCEPRLGYKIGRRIAGVCASRVDVEGLDGGSAIPWQQLASS